MQDYSFNEYFERFPIAMAYVPWQTFKEPYEPAKALVIGTIFPELDKKFTGKREDINERFR